MRVWASRGASLARRLIATKQRWRTQNRANNSAARLRSFQLVQQKLVWMAQEITKAQLLALRLTRLMEAGTSRPAQISMAKRNNVWMALQCARKARDILGAAGITDQLFRDSTRS